MKKKVRSIIVNDMEYKWRVGRCNCDGDGGCRYTIWKDKKMVFEEIIHNKDITPQMVRETIENLVSR